LTTAHETTSLAEQFSADLDLAIRSVSLIQRNAYCAIYRVDDGETPYIVKQYHGDDPSLASAEAEAVDFYHGLACENAALIDSRAVRLNPDRNIVCLGFVQGECFSKTVYRGRTNRAERDRSCRIMTTLGSVLREIRTRTAAPGAPTSPFMFEYIRYCSGRLRNLPVLGPTLFRNMVDSAEHILETFQAADVTPSFIHGDFVCRNIHVDGDRVGLIDFANTIATSHTLNDVYNMRTTLGSLLLPPAYRRELLDAFAAGLGDLDLEEAAHRFYYEYHRRRWLMLKLYSRSPANWALSAAALASFCRPYERTDVSR